MNARRAAPSLTSEASAFAPWLALSNGRNHRRILRFGIGTSETLAPLRIDGCSLGVAANGAIIQWSPSSVVSHDPVGTRSLPS